MSSELTKLSFQKIDNKTCIIKEEVVSFFGNTNFELVHSKEDTMVTALMFLCDLIYSNEIKSALISALREDLGYKKEENVSRRYMDSNLVSKYVSEATILKQVLDRFFIHELNVNEAAKANLKEDILKHAAEDSYEFFDDFEGVSGAVLVQCLHNLVILEKHLTVNEIDEIKPQTIFELTLKANYLSDIESLTPEDSTLDSWMNEWLPKK